MKSRTPMPTDDIAERLDDVARLLALLLRRERTLQDSIAEFAEAGFSQVRIASLLNTTPNYVNVALTRATKKKKAPNTRQ